jgi:hypothetical protein
MPTMLDDLQRFMPMAGVIGSLMSGALTLYFWMIRATRERPDVRLFHAPIRSKTSLGINNGETRWMDFELALVAGNFSSTPNAIIDVELKIRTKRGVWQPVNHLALHDAERLPANIPPMTTAFIPVSWAIKFPPSTKAEANEEPADIVRGYLDEYLSSPYRVSVTATTLGGKVFRSELAVEAPKPLMANAVVSRAA